MHGMHVCMYHYYYIVIIINIFYTVLFKQHSYKVFYKHIKVDNMIKNHLHKHIQSHASKRQKEIVIIQCIMKSNVQYMYLVTNPTLQTIIHHVEWKMVDMREEGKLCHMTVQITK